MMNATTESAKVESIVRWCNDHYEEGGHWVLESMDRQQIADRFVNIEDAIAFCRRKEGRRNECQ